MLGVLFRGEGKAKQEIDRQIWVASPVMRLLYRSFEVKTDLNQKVKLSIYHSVCANPPHNHKLWVVTEIMRSQIQVDYSRVFSVGG